MVVLVGLATPEAVGTLLALPEGRDYDEIVVWAPHVAAALAGEGIKAVRVIQFGYDPAIYHPPSAPLEVRWDVAMIGQHYPSRFPYVEALAAQRLTVSGLGWTRAAAGTVLAGKVGDSSFDGPETCRIYWSSAFGLNPLAPWNIPAHNMRSFEVPASGAVLISQRTPDHLRLFGEHGAVLVESPAEARDAVKALLCDPPRREAVSARGVERVAPHTYDSRVAELLAGIPR